MYGTPAISQSSEEGTHEGNWECEDANVHNNVGYGQGQCLWERAAALILHLHGGAPVC